MVGTINPSVSGYDDDQPRGSVCIKPKGELKSFKTAQADLQVGMVANYTSSGLDRVDAAADAKLLPKHLEVPDMPTGARTDPMTDYIYEQYETANYYDMSPGYQGFFKCKDNTNTIDYNQTLELDTTNEGHVKRMATTATVDSGNTAVTSTAANGAIISGENEPLCKIKSLKVAQRGTSATVSWIAGEVM